MQDPRFGQEFFGNFVCFIDTALISGLLLVPGSRAGRLRFSFLFFFFVRDDLTCVPGAGIVSVLANVIYVFAFDL